MSEFLNFERESNIRSPIFCFPNFIFLSVVFYGAFFSFVFGSRATNAAHTNIL